MCSLLQVMAKKHRDTACEYDNRLVDDVSSIIE